MDEFHYESYDNYKEALDAWSTQTAHTQIAINAELSSKGLAAYVFVITNILTSDSEVLVLGEKQDKVAAAFGKTLENDFMTLEGVVSRKKQVVPQITEEFSK